MSASSAPEALRLAACEIARAAGAVVRGAFGKGGGYERKGIAVDLVTDTDRASEAVIARMVAERFPTHGLLAEEGTHHEAEAGEPVWIIDPLDGTTNFAHGIPLVTVSIGVVRGDVLLAGVVYDPLREELFSACSRGGAWLGERRLSVSSSETLGASVLATGFPYDRRERADYYLAFWHAMVPRTQGTRRGGSAAMDLAWVAAGRYDGYWEFGLKPWDCAAGALLVQEAGGKVSDRHGAPLDLHDARVVASNGRIHAELLEALSEAKLPVPVARR